MLPLTGWYWALAVKATAYYFSFSFYLFHMYYKMKSTDREMYAASFENAGQMQQMSAVSCTYCIYRPDSSQPVDYLSCTKKCFPDMVFFILFYFKYVVKLIS